MYIWLGVSRYKLIPGPPWCAWDWPSGDRRGIYVDNDAAVLHSPPTSALQLAPEICRTVAHFLNRNIEINIWRYCCYGSDWVTNTVCVDEYDFKMLGQVLNMMGYILIGNWSCSQLGNWVVASDRAIRGKIAITPTQSTRTRQHIHIYTDTAGLLREVRTVRDELDCDADSRLWLDQNQQGGQVGGLVLWRPGGEAAKWLFWNHF